MERSHAGFGAPENLSLKTQWLYQRVRAGESGRMKGADGNTSFYASRGCPHCGAFALKTILSYERARAFWCKECGGFSNNPGVADHILYDDDYFRRNYFPRQRKQFEHSRRYLETIKRFVSGGSVLDYGCGSGIFLKAAQEYGFTENVGADISIPSLLLAKKNVGEGCRLVHLDSSPLPKRKFEVVALMDSISHIRDLGKIILELKDHHMADQGVLVIRTPNIPPWYLRSVAFASKLIGSKNASVLMFAKRRYMLFSCETLLRYLDSLGFSILHFEMVKEYFLPLKVAPVRLFLEGILYRVLGIWVKPMLVIAAKKSTVGVFFQNSQSMSS